MSHICEFVAVFFSKSKEELQLQTQELGGKLSAKVIYFCLTKPYFSLKFPLKSR